MKCSICGADVDAAYNSCPYCGNKIDWPEIRREVEEPPETPYNDEFRYCIRCGRPLDMRTHSCPSCGYRYTSASGDTGAGSSGSSGTERKAPERSAGGGTGQARSGERSGGSCRQSGAPRSTGGRGGAAPVRAAGRTAGKIVKGAASAIPSGGGSMSKKKKGKNKKKNNGKIAVLSVLGLMALFAVTFLIFFKLLGGSFSDAEPSASPSPTATVSASPSPTASASASAAPAWTPSVATRAPEAQRPQQGAGTERTQAPAAEPERTRSPERTSAPVIPEDEPAAEEPETGGGVEEQPIAEEPGAEELPEDGNVLEVE